MLRKSSARQDNLYSELYNNIPATHILKTIDSALCFDFINELLESSYCKNFGRPAKEPETMAKLLILQELYGLSDERVIEETQVNLAYMWFIGINPGDQLPHPSLLSKFRTMRLKDVTLDEIMTEVVRQCIVKQIISAKEGESIDAMHISANTTKKVPERIMKHLAKKIFKAMEQTDYEIPDYKQLEDHKEAKRVMKDYLENVIELADERAEKEVTKAKEIIDSPLFIEQKGIRSLIDTDARVGYKSKTDSFFGYKMEYTMTTGSRLITAVGVYSGEYVDGTDFKILHNRSKQSGITIESAYGDKAYFRKDILSTLKEECTKAYIPVNACSYRIDEELFRYNKDSDQWICKNGNHSISKQVKTTTRKDRGKSTYYEYKFEKEECLKCAYRSECIKTAKTKGKKLIVGTSAGEYYAHNQWTKTDAFADEYKKRASIEGKNAELKMHHGLSRAKGFGLRSVTIQAKLAAIAVNLKRIAAIISAGNPELLPALTKLWNNMANHVFWSRHAALFVLVS